jgi:hypothetical protein
MSMVVILPSTQIRELIYQVLKAVLQRGAAMIRHPTATAMAPHMTAMTMEDLPVTAV